MLMSNMVIMLLAMYECTEEEIHVAAKGTNTTNECTEGPEVNVNSSCSCLSDKVTLIESTEEFPPQLLCTNSFFLIIFWILNAKCPK